MIPNRHARRAAAVAERRHQSAIAHAARNSSERDYATPGAFSGPQRVCLSAIMKESDPAVVERCLRSAIPLIQAWRIADSGCSDAVKATIHRVLDGIPGELLSITWTGFSDARNVALDAARDSGCDYALFLDADDFIEPRVLRMQGARLTLLPLPDLRLRDFWVCENELKGQKFYRVAFARLSLPVRWFGRVHEELVPRGVFTELLREYRVRCTHDGSASRAGNDAKKRYYRDLLLAEVGEDPTNPFTWHKLADAHVDAGDCVAALAAIERMMTLELDEHMRYSGLVRRADLLGALMRPTADVIAAFDAAMTYRTDRAEGPRWLAKHLRWRGEQLDRARDLDAFADSLPVPATTRWVHLGSYKEHRL